jgi:tetratricopeptide (TPR) repeat protein
MPLAGSRKTFGPVPVPPPLRPVLPSLHRQARAAGKGDDEGDEQTTVDPQAAFREPGPDVAAALGPPPVTPLPPEEAGAAGPPDDVNGEIDIDQKSTMTEAIEDDSGEILLEPGPDGELHQVDHLASGTGETGGASLDDPTEDESSRSSAPLTVVPGDPLTVEPARAPVIRRPALEPQPSSPALSPAWLVVQSGTDRGRRFALRSGLTSVGRGVDNDVVLTDIAVSRKHLTIEFDGASYIMNDLGSGNGTMVNSRDEDGSFRLGHGDKLELGNTVLVFESTAASLQAQALGKWSGAQDAEEPSTIAGRKPPGGPVGHVAGTAAPPSGREHGRPLSSAPPPLPRPGPRSAQMAAQMPPGQGLGGRPPGQGAPHGPQHGAPHAPGAAPHAPLSLGGGPSFGPPLPGGPSPSVNPPRSHRASSPPPPRGGRPPPLAPSAPPQARTLSTEAAIALANRHMPQPATGGFSQFPGGPGAFGGSGARPPMAQPLSYTGQPGFNISPSTASSPRFQYPNGVMAPLAPSNERRRVLIGILCLAFVAVGAGIVMALVHGGGEAAATAPPARASVPGPAATAPSDATASPAAASVAADAPAGAAAAQPSTPALLHHLYGDQELRPVDFGTDEQFLSGIGGARPADEAPTPTATAVADDAEEAEEETSAREEDTSARDERRRRREARRRAREAEEAEEAEVAESSDDEEEETVDRPAADADTAQRRAASLYRNRRFTEAADALRSGAEQTSGRSAARMRELAVNYAKIGALLSEGQETTVSDAPRALRAFRDALRLDEEFGDGVHDRAIGARIAQVSPGAAAAFMARKDYAEAKRAADIAEKFGAGARVASVRTSLERKATQLYEEAKAQADSGDSDQAAETARQILRMVPRSSDLYARASRLAG